MLDIDDLAPDVERNCLICGVYSGRSDICLYCHDEAVADEVSDTQKINDSLAKQNKPQEEI